MDIIKSNVVVGVAAALAATILAPVLIPVIVTAGRPLAKSMLKGGLMLYEKSREAVANAGEVMEDLIAEVRSEAEHHRAASMANMRAAAEGAVSRPADDMQTSAEGGRGNSQQAAAPAAEPGAT